jgi:hypothetical protein
MGTEHVAYPDVEDQPDNLAVEMRAIAEEATSLMILGHQLRGRIDAALALLEPAPAPLPDPETAPPRTLRAFGRAYLERFSSQTIRQDLVEARGAQAAAVFATKLDHDLVARGKVRPVIQGRNGEAYAG